MMNKLVSYFKRKRLHRLLLAEAAVGAKIRELREMTLSLTQEYMLIDASVSLAKIQFKIDRLHDRLGKETEVV